VVGVQPFGGEGKSGTGPKAGGPLYLKRLQRGAAPLLDVIPEHARQPDAALEALLGWLRANGQQPVAALAEGYARSSLNGVTIDLPGPTGERNQLSFTPRGAVLCAPGTQAGLLNQLAASLATGNHALVLAPTPDLIPADLPAAVKARVRFIGKEEVDGGEFALALVESGLAGLLRTGLAARPGAIVGIVDTEPHEAIDLWRLVVERAVCVNTTAAGGNASLMTLGL